ncbi:PAS domain-containing protein [Hymenobacter sp. BT186]|uniref:histidine kinase n=1 Tax=Hymenobacter telluris TaxID=2816474 RepID=A0A939EUJ7_9BACT|nr:sensor histidine kinase [Hymenobacter telluris]MBO0357795.1 PAS domain-containing protein [Hymenobacter telluris]MBW3373822.1 cell wall metabolism sensor histidine kinase WalK [Hymenobacter norwichensis]
MTLKTKIRLSILTMLVLLLALGGYAFQTIQRLEGGARGIQVANFNSVEYGLQMLRAVEQLEQQPTATAPLEQFRWALTREAANITERGELELVDTLTQHLADYQTLVDEQAPRADQQRKLRQLQAEIHRAVDLNTVSFNAKTQAATTNAARARQMVLIFISLSAAIGLVLIVRLPREVLRPLRRLTADVEDVASPGPTHLVPIAKNDEVGAVALALNRAFGYMQDQRSATRVALATERNRLESLVEHLDEGLLLLDESGCVLLANPTARRLLDRAAADLVGHKAEDLSRESELLAQLFQPMLAPAASPTTGSSPQLFTFRHQGEEVYYRLTASHIVSYNKELRQTEFAGHILSLRNVSEFKKLDEVKSNFLATVSHELKTPLASINLSLMLLQDERTDPEERLRIADGIREETTRLLGMVGQLIDVSRLDAGAGIKLDVCPVALADVVEYAVDTVQPQFQDKELILETNLPPTLPAARADLEKTTWVLINLLANAIRYSPRGARLLVQATQLPTHELQVSVQDYGPGIPAEYHERIFQRFAEVPNPAGHKGGSGLGLSISREFINAQGGRLWVESSPGAGSRFLFTLPSE